MRPNNVDRLIKRMEAEPSEDLDRRIQILLDAQPTAILASVWGRAVRSRTARLGVAAAVLLAVALLAITAWSYWSTMADLFKVWQSNEDYSAGQLVPLVALLFLWVRRKQLRECVLKPYWWGGITLLVLAYAARMYGLLFMFESAQRYSLVFTVAGLVLLVAGRQVFRHTFWTLLFLLLMVPLPGRIHNMISGPLQRLATSGSVFILEAFLPRVSQQGNVVMLNENTPMAVAEACSGLRMLTAFIIVAGFIAFMVKRAPWQKAVLLASSIPVAVVCNIIRIVATAILMLLVSTQAGEKFFHDFAGIVMMPAAVLLHFGEVWLMDRIVVPEAPAPQKSAQVVTSEGSNSHLAVTAVVVASCLMLVFGLTYRVVTAKLNAPINTTPISPDALTRFPLQIGDWTGVDVPMDEAIVRATDTDACLNRRYTHRGGFESLTFYIASGVKARDLMPHRPEVCYRGAGWTLMDKRLAKLPLSDSTALPCNIMQFSRGVFNTQKVVVLDYYLVDGQYCADVSLLRSKAWRGSDRVRYVAQIQIAAPITATSNAEAAIQTLCDFAVESAALTATLFDDPLTKQNAGELHEPPKGP